MIPINDINRTSGISSIIENTHWRYHFNFKLLVI